MSEEDRNGSPSDSPLTPEDRARIKEFVSGESSNPSTLVPDEDTTTPGRTADQRGDTADETADSERTGPDASPGRSRDTADTADGEIRPSDCRDIRRRMKEAERVREVVDEYPHKTASAVLRHAYGDCSCSEEVVDESPTAVPYVSVDACREFREAYRNGRTPSVLSREFSRTTNSIMRHVYGRCTHSRNPRAVSPSEVPEADCSRLREIVRRVEQSPVESAATALRLRPEVAAFHIRGYCSCEVDTPPIASDTTD